MDKKEIHSRSCTTMVALPKATKDGDTIFAKNSDRPVNESQPLEFHPAADHEVGSYVQCSFIKVKQVAHTYACIGSRPTVFFGFEHGINEHGVVIGNEQVSGREIPEGRWGLIGMDILRLGLERSTSARQAVEVMGELLETYGTGGDPSTRIAPFNSNYIIADANEAYKFESHQRSWAAEKIEGTGYISNCYSILNYDIVSDRAKQEAVEKGWIDKEQVFEPARAWTVDDCVFAESEGFVRYARLDSLMNNREPLTVKDMMNNLRDHYNGAELGQTIFSPAAAKIPCICSHPGGPSGCATAASTVTVVRKDVPKEIRFTYWGSMAPPCCSVFRPFYNIDWLPEDLGKAALEYTEADQWWRFTELERYIALNYDKFAPKVKKEFDAMENAFIQEAAEIEKNYSGDVARLKEFSGRASRESLEKAIALTNEIKSTVKTKDIDRMLLNYFVTSSDVCGMDFDRNIIK